MPKKKEKGGGWNSGNHTPALISCDQGSCSVSLDLIFFQNCEWVGIEWVVNEGLSNLKPLGSHFIRLKFLAPSWLLSYTPHLVHQRVRVCTWISPHFWFGYCLGPSSHRPSWDYCNSLYLFSCFSFSSSNFLILRTGLALLTQKSNHVISLYKALMTSHLTCCKDNLPSLASKSLKWSGFPFLSDLKSCSSSLQSLNPTVASLDTGRTFCLRAFESLFPWMKCSFTLEAAFAPLPLSLSKLERLSPRSFVIKQQLPPWPCERLKAEREDSRGWDGWLAWT